jgi:hypothetical protein
MSVFSSKFSSDNRKSKTCTAFDKLRTRACRRIQNPKWLGLSVIAFVLVVCGAVVEAQQAGKIFRIGFLDEMDPARICSQCG